MARFRTIVLWAACASTLGCGGYTFIGFVSNPGGAASVSGVVTAVSSGYIEDKSGATQYTSVSFRNTGNETTLNFCGDQQRLFPIGVMVLVDYTAGIVCSVLTRVVVTMTAQLHEPPCLRSKNTRGFHFSLRTWSCLNSPEQILSVLSVVTASAARDYRSVNPV